MRFDDIRKRWAAARWTPAVRGWLFAVFKHAPTPDHYSDDETDVGPADAAAIAHAPEDIAALLAEVDRLRGDEWMAVAQATEDTHTKLRLQLAVEQAQNRAKADHIRHLEKCNDAREHECQHGTTCTGWWYT